MVHSNCGLLSFLLTMLCCSQSHSDRLVRESTLLDKDTIYQTLMYQSS